MPPVTFHCSAFPLDISGGEKMLGLFEVFLLVGAGFADYFEKMLFSFFLS